MSLDIDITYVLVLALFLPPLVVLNTLVFKPFLELFEKRHEHLEGALDRAERALEQATKEEKNFKAKIRVATTEGIERRNALRSEAESRMQDRIEAERTTIQSKLEEALRELRERRIAALVEMKQEAEKIAELTAAKLLGRSL